MIGHLCNNRELQVMVIRENEEEDLGGEERLECLEDLAKEYIGDLSEQLESTDDDAGEHECLCRAIS